MKDVLSAPYLITEWQPDTIANVLEGLIPQRCRVVVVGQIPEIKLTQVEPWYKTKYIVKNIPESTVKVSFLALFLIRSHYK